MKIKKSLIFEGMDGLGDSGENEVAVFFTVLGEANPSGGPVSAPAKGAGDRVDIDPTLGSKADSQATFRTKFK